MFSSHSSAMCLSLFEIDLLSKLPVRVRAKGGFKTFSFSATTIVVLCFTSSFVRSLQFLQSLRILILFDFRRIIMLETRFPYPSSSPVGPFILHKVRWCLSTRFGPRTSFLSCFRVAPSSPHCLVSVILTIIHILRTYSS